VDVVPVPPKPVDNIPPKVIAPVVGDAGDKPVLPPLKDVTGFDITAEIVIVPALFVTVIPVPPVIVLSV
jgi:hypothetical protein